MSLAAGAKLGPYEIVGPLGAGGMGEVYRAKDTRLGRDVALKILPASICADAVAKQRFEREAKTISGLNHPNICTLHDVGSQDGVDYLVMECVEGETLAKRLEKGPLPLEQVLKYGAQVAEALDKAHRNGIVHRDLKPGNVMLTATGAKLLDFGLAKPTAPMVTLATLTMAAPQASPVTQEGMVVGTFQYMSPEQVEGKELDGRSDIFSLGAVLYEMVTGKKAFEGKTQLSVASAILEKEPVPISAIKPLAPANLDHAIRKCLAKDRDERWQTARDLASELKWVGESGSQGAAALVYGEKKKVAAWVPWALCGVLMAGLAAGAIGWRSSRPLEHTMYFSAPLPFAAWDMAIAPNGHTIAVVGFLESVRKNVLWIYEVGSANARSLPDTEGANFPFWSADGRSLGFFADGKLKRLDIAGGPVQILCDAPNGRGGTWNQDGVILFTPAGQLGFGLSRIAASGGTPSQISVPDRDQGEDSHRWPVFLPDGTHFLYLAANVSGQVEPDAIYMGTLGTKEKKLITKATANAVYAAPGYLLFYRDKTLFAQRFDLKKFELTGEPTALMTGIQYFPRILRAVMAASNGGLLAAQNRSAVSLSRLIWFDRNGKELGIVGKPDVYANVNLSPSGKMVALDKTDIATLNADVWTYDLEHESAKRITFNPAIDALAVWSPDEKQLVFASSRERLFDLYTKTADGSQEEKLIEHDQADDYPNDWSRDGKYILYLRGNDMWFRQYPGGKGQEYLKVPGVVKNGQFSPDGRWIAYASNETGKWEVYVTSFPERRGKWQVSLGGGEQPRWRGDGKELYYLAPDGKMMAAPVKGESTFDAGAPVTLFQANPHELIATSDQVVYDVSKNGQRFLINTRMEQAQTQPMSLVVNWDAELKRK